MTHRVVIEGDLTVSEEVWPAQAAVMLDGPRRSGWASDYPTPGTRLTVDRLAASVRAGTWAPGFGMYTLRPRGGLVCGGWAFSTAPDEAGRVEIGYGLAPSGRGRGLMTDAVRAAVRWALAQPAVRCVWAGVDHDNHPSIAVLERAGLRRVADRDGSRRYEIGPGASDGPAPGVTGRSG
ncbi:GNAT family N-acetyltransferase [Desertihabitans aurantiacus]|uniref:GNAT family N-acetyltransferase n=1 Tax=Desertihabitans aurantiacus TaxID=2282477 RepID=UPI000DF76E1E|nr:GNAT family protein [Desertihabitans aurantiacus]